MIYEEKIAAYKRRGWTVCDESTDHIRSCYLTKVFPATITLSGTKPERSVTVEILDLEDCVQVITNGVRVEEFPKEV